MTEKYFWLFRFEITVQTGLFYFKSVFVALGQVQVVLNVAGGTFFTLDNISVAHI